MLQGPLARDAELIFADNPELERMFTLVTSVAVGR
jgi:hypothetical protein